MEKYGTLKVLAEIIIIFAWLELIGAVIAACVLLFGRFEFSLLLVFSVMLGGGVGFVFLKGFGYLIILMLDIRHNQILEGTLTNIDKSDVLLQQTVKQYSETTTSLDVEQQTDCFRNKNINESKKETYVYFGVSVSKIYLETLNKIINEQKAVIFGTLSYGFIVKHINSLVVSEESAFSLLKSYEIMFDVDLILEIKSMTSKHSVVKSCLEPFIELKIVEPNHPHNRLKRSCD